MLADQRDCGRQGTIRQTVESLLEQMLNFTFPYLIQSGSICRTLYALS